VFRESKSPKLPILMHCLKSKIEFFLNPNQTKVYLTSMAICGKNFRPFDYLNQKIIILEVKKKFIPSKQNQQTLSPLQVKYLLYTKMWILTIHNYLMLVSLIQNFRIKYRI